MKLWLKLLWKHRAKLWLNIRPCFFSWKVPPSPNEFLKSSEVIIGLAFGQRLTNPGTSNRAMAKIARHLHYYYQLPLILQLEVSRCLMDLPKAGVIFQHRLEDKCLDTYEVLAQAWEICQKNGWRKAIIVSHPDHLWRAKKTAEKIGFEVSCVDTSSHPYLIPYDRESIQPWTKSRLRFLPREIAARTIYLLQDKI